MRFTLSASWFSSRDSWGAMRRHHWIIEKTGAVAVGGIAAG